jgi:hypothetical protein
MAAKLRIVTWDGALPKPGEYVRLSAGGICWLVNTCESMGPGRIALRLSQHAGALPRGAVAHSYARVQGVDPAGPPRVRQVAGSGATAVMRSAWRDPTDISPNASRRPREVQGFRVFCALRRARASGAAITDQHIIAADLLRVNVDLARLGASPLVMAAGANCTGPRAGPSASALRAARASTNVGRLFNSLDDAQATLLIAVVLQNIPVSRWCTLHEPKLNRPTVMRALYEVLDLLVEYFDTEVQRVLTTDSAVINV